MIPNLFKRKTATALVLGGALSIAAIACGTDNGAPAAGGNGSDNDSVDPTPPPTSSVESGYDAARLALEANGSVVVNTGEEPSGTFNTPLTKLLVNGESVELYEFASSSDASTAAARVSDDGTLVSDADGGPAVAIDFLNPPHYYQQDEVIIVYTGGDAEVIELLRETFGEEFAGDTSPVDPGAADSPGYETVLAPAPIDSVEVIEDPDNPGFFLLRVTSGLPGGCASFHDISVEQTGELELTLTVLNRVPAPGELIACTQIYGMVEHTVPLGSGNDNLDTCEVYTVRWENHGENESLRFQVTAPNVRCEAPDEPIDNGDGPVVAPIISDLDALLFGLRALGIEVEIGEDGGSSLFDGAISQVITINGERIEIFSFGPGDGALRAASGVSPDGFEIANGPGGSVTNVLWISTPHFYLAGNSIVLYVGVNDGIISALDSAAGPKFAGPGGEPVGPIGDKPDPLPLPPQMDTVLVPAPIVSVGDIMIAESFPPQYFVEIVSAQPNGCNLDAGWDVEIDGTDVIVTVQNTEPANLAVVLCTAIYGETTHNVRLGSGEFESGVEYTLIVNGEVSDTFVAQ